MDIDKILKQMRKIDNKTLINKQIENPNIKPLPYGLTDKQKYLRTLGAGR